MFGVERVPVRSLLAAAAVCSSMTTAGVVLQAPTASAACTYYGNKWSESCMNSAVQVGVYADTHLQPLSNGGYSWWIEGVTTDSGTNCHDFYSIGVASGLPGSFGPQGSGYAIVDYWQGEGGHWNVDQLDSNISPNGADTPFQINYNGPAGPVTSPPDGDYYGEYGVNGQWQLGALAYYQGYGSCDSYAGTFGDVNDNGAVIASSGTWDFSPEQWEAPSGVWSPSGFTIGSAYPACTPTQQTNCLNGAVYSASNFADNIKHY